MPSSFRLEPDRQAQEQKLREYMEESQFVITQMERLLMIGTTNRYTLVDGHIQEVERVWVIPWAEKYYTQCEDILRSIRRHYGIEKE